VKKFYQSQAGYTLLEVILGTLILVILVIPVSLYWSNTHQLINLVNNEEAAINLAEDSIARMQAAARKTRDKNTDGNNTNNINHFEEYCSKIADKESQKVSDLNSGVDFIREVEIESVDDNLMAINVKVFWNQKKDNVKLDTIIYFVE